MLAWRGANFNAFHVKQGNLGPTQIFATHSTQCADFSKVQIKQIAKL